MPLRGEEQRAAIRAVVDTFGEDARVFVFIGGCTLGLYARSAGAPLRVTKDVDCISTLSPWVLQEKRLGEMCSRGILTPDPDLQCRYRIRESGILVDVLSPEGFNVGGVNRWFARGARRARSYDTGDGRSVLAVSPPYFLAMKLEAFGDRGPDAQSSKDAEDIVSLAVEIEDLVAQVDAEGLRGDIAELWTHVLKKHGIATQDLPDFVDWHLDRRECDHRQRVLEAIVALVGG
jgi:hypothetical protein